MNLLVEFNILASIGDKFYHLNLTYLMRKSIFIVFLLAGLTLQSQTKTFIGVKAGGGASTAYMQHSIFPVFTEISWIPGSTAGLQITHFPHKYPTTMNAAIQWSLNWVQKGWRQQFSDLEIESHKTRINYIEMPLEAVMYIGDKNKYYFSVGFFLEYAISENVDSKPNEAVMNTTYPKLYQVGQSYFYPYNINRDFRLNYGPRGGAGVFRETNSGVFRLEFYFTFSIRSVYDYETPESAIPDLSLNYGVGVTLGYMFSLGKLNLVD